MRPMYKNQYLTLGMKRRRVIHIQSFFFCWFFCYILYTYFIYIFVVSVVLFCSFYMLISFYHLILVQFKCIEFILFMEAVVIIMCVMINVKWEKPRAKIIHLGKKIKLPKFCFRINLGKLYENEYTIFPIRTKQSRFYNKIVINDGV